MAGVALVFLLLVVRFFFTERNTHEKEREWFARNLKYEFSVTIDSVHIFNRTTGRLHGSITAGYPLTYREDSLRNSLKKYEKLQFISKQRGDSITFILYNANEIEKGDSLRISSTENSITVFRTGKQLSSTPLSGTLNGWGKAPIGN